ncbi:MAG TPA: glutamate--tRNA ligase [Thermomicrobiales bacterium]|nr:glutamate--tRNA ligase [Thermomicrobiales bacterium]
MTDTAQTETQMTIPEDRPTAIPADMKEVRVRFAPSPTGSLHIGGAKLVMYNVLFAHGQAKREGKKGTFILRIEDTDQKRLIEGAAENLMDELRWLGLEWDEGPDVGGPYGPYVQSQRTHHYKEAAERLIESGHAYRCFCSPERLKQVREDFQKRGLPPGYDRHCRNLSADEAQAKLDAGESYVVRYKMPREGETRFTDLLRGEIVYENEKLEDLVILKSDGFPTYHLAVVVDDHEMNITHVTRGPEWIPTAPLHVQLYGALGWEMPIFAHMPLILAPTGGKLSKRHGGASVADFREGGYLPEALLNYLALLGWSLDDKTEVFTMDGLLEHFTIERVSASPATFDRNKLDWMNQHWINHLITVEDLALRCLPFLIEAGTIADGPVDESHPRFDDVKAAATLLKDRIKLLTEAPDLMSYFLQDELPDYDAATLVPKKVEPDTALKALEAVAGVMSEVDVTDEEGTEARLRALAEELGLKAGQLFMPIRVAATGRAQSPGLFETLRVIGQERVERRIAQAVEKLKAS